MSGCELLGSADNGMEILELRSRAVEDNSGLRSRLAVITTMTAKIGKYLKIFFASFEFCLGYLLSKIDGRWLALTMAGKRWAPEPK
jgi:hypothetical protein